MNRIVNITANDTELSLKTKTRLSAMLEKAGFIVSKEFNHHAELTVCIGGDGAFLQTMHEHNFPSMPIIGINTGHLGFFQEISPDKLDDFIFNYTQNMYRLQKLTTVKATVKTEESSLQSMRHLRKSLTEHFLLMMRSKQFMISIMQMRSLSECLKRVSALRQSGLRAATMWM